MTLLQLTGMLIAVGSAPRSLARYFPSLPLFNRLILKPEPWTGVEADDVGAPAGGGGGLRVARLPDRRDRADDLALAPTGKARFGNLLIDVASAGGYVEPDSLVEVVDVQGSRVIVKKM